MLITTIQVLVNLEISSELRLTEADKEQVVSDLSYKFSFSDIVSGNRVEIIDTEIVDIVE